MTKKGWILLLFCLLPGGCQDLGEPPSSDCDAPAQIDPTIVVGESIARIRIGDTRCDVIRKVGEPTDRLPGDMRGEIYVYAEAPFKYMLIAISDDRALGLGVIGVTIDGAYSGLTHDGIGIRSGRSFVTDRLGVPNMTDGEPPNDDHYYFPNSTFLFTYVNERVFRISMSTLRRFF